MDTNNFILNDIFKENAKVYQTKPVRATKYQHGMELDGLYICRMNQKAI